ncbi:MAG: coproporphyrinogen dehydrogenase HemZ [Peptostreptococcaceae bacterium]|nr:coproporphyrinogen dehydrogenase HemZ [Peptostreptococcaceae bacterium]
MKIYMTDSTFRYDIEALAKAIFKTEKLETTRDHDVCGPLLAIFHSKEENYCNVKVFWKDRENRIFEKCESVKLFSKDERENKKQVRRRLKFLIVKAVLGENSGIVLPWGTLTGIKPSKLVHEMIKDGMKPERVRLKLKNDYLISDEKINLVMNVASIEHEFLYPPDPKKISIYIGIPFCPSKCLYCSFPTMANAGEDIKTAYVKALTDEIRHYASEIEPFEIETIYIGGGTPTELSAKLLNEIMDVIHGTFNLNGLKEFTVEAGRPDTINEEKLSVLKNRGVDRISINPQTFNDKTLEIVKRGHTSEDVNRVWEMVRPYAFQSVNMDLIVGLPGERLYEMSRTMEAVNNINPDNLTVHTLALKKNAEMRKSSVMSILPDEETVRKMIALAENGATSLGMEPYYMYRQKYMLGNMENIGYAKLGKACLYNIQMMNDLQSVIAFGSGVMTKFVSLEENRILRAANYKQVRDYIRSPVEMAERKKSTKKTMDNIGR